MALVIYPSTDYDSFISVVDATTSINTMTVFASQWDDISNAEKEIYLRIACRRIEDGIDQIINPYPDPMPSCAGEAQALMAVQDLVYGISAGTSTTCTGSIKKQKVGSLEVEYFDTKSKQTKMISIIPQLARVCLESLGYETATQVAGLSQTLLGRA